MSNVFTSVVRLARDCEVRQTQAGAVLNFTAANDVGFGDKKTTNWLACSIWGKKAESELSRYLLKGVQVLVSGEIKLDEYLANDGTKKPQLRLNVQLIQLVGKKSDNPQAPAPAAAYTPQPPPQGSYVPPHEQHRRDVANHNQQQQGYPQGDVPYDDDIPF